jgi:hypothetical protein
MKLMVTVTPERLISIHIIDDADKMLAHIELDPENVRTVMDTLEKCTAIAEAGK